MHDVVVVSHFRTFIINFEEWFYPLNTQKGQNKKNVFVNFWSSKSYPKNKTIGSGRLKTTPPCE